MKRLAPLFSILALCVLFTVPAWAATPLNEVAFTIGYERPETGGHTLTADAEVGFAWKAFRVGPALSLVDSPGDDQTLVGAIFEVNLGEKDHGPAFGFGARGLYDSDAEEGADDTQLAARVFLKLFLERAFVKFQVEQVVSGFGEDDDLTGAGFVGFRY